MRDYMIPPHGGKLVHRVIKKDITGLENIDIPVELQRDVQNIGRGVFSPLQGFMGFNETESVITEGRLPNGTPWTIPILLPANNGLQEGTDVLLNNTAVMHIKEVFSLDKKKTVQSVFGTDSLKHPGVKRFMSFPDTFAAGPIDVINDTKEPYSTFNLEPKETRVLFKEKGWKTVCGFQTRNPPHTGHENLQKTVLGLVDGIFINPLIGRKKPGDFTDSAILNAYKTMITHYIPRERAVLSILSTEMRYAGPKEAIHHAICRKNFGCTHFIVGRDHAGVGDFYDSEAAINIFDDYPDMGIEIISVRGDFFYCNKCNHLASDRTCPHNEKYHIKFSGTKIREMLRAEKRLPPEIMRPEVVETLLKEDTLFVGE